jgi:hypothetical protein
MSAPLSPSQQSIPPLGFPSVNSPGGIDFWKTRFESHAHGHSDPSVASSSNPHDLYSSASYTDMDDLSLLSSENNFSEFDRFDAELSRRQQRSRAEMNGALETRDLSALRGGAFAATVKER